MIFDIYSANLTGNNKNCKYPNHIEVSDVESLRKAVSTDYVVAKYKDNYRSKNNFISTDCIAMDCDNDSENPKDWVSPEMIRERFPDVAFAVHFSRNNNKEKGGKAARPRFHCFFPINEVKDPDEYANMKKRLLAMFDFFDKNASDAARFFFGTENPEVLFFEGNKFITDTDEFIETNPAATDKSNNDEYKEGSRNVRMHNFALKKLTLLGDTKEAKDAYYKEAEKCTPPLDDSELKIIWKHALDYFKGTIENSEEYIAPEEFKKHGKYKPTDYSDIGQARVMAEVYGDILRYSSYTSFLVYDGIRWVEDKCRARALAQELTDKQLEESEKLYKKASLTLSELNIKEQLEDADVEDERKKATAVCKAALRYFKYSTQERACKAISNTLTEVAPMISIQPCDLDSDPFLLNTPEGTYDLRTGEMRENRPEDYITKVTAIAPGKKGEGLWEKQLKLIFCDDEELIEYAKLVVGLSLIGRVFSEQLIIAHGDGANGKSTFWNSIFRVLGSYAGKVSADTLTVGNRRNIKPEMAELKGVRLAIASELEEGNRLNTATVKQLCSTDEIYAEKKYKDPYFFKPSHTLVLYTNHLPKVGAVDSGTWRRLTVVPFNAKITGKSDIKNYGDYLFENAGEAILAWAIEGAKEVIAQDYKIELPAAVHDATKAYHDQNDWIGNFFDECCEIGDHYSAGSGEFYQAYREHCMKTGEFIRGTTEFYAAIEAVEFITRKKTKNGAFVYGIKLKSTGYSEEIF